MSASTARGEFRIYRAALPEVCSRDLSLMVFTGDADGRCEIFTWDAATRRTRQVTDRPGGTMHAAIDADAHVWWFDEDEDGIGRWRHQPFAGGPDRDGLIGVPPGTPRGLAVADAGAVAMALGDGDGTGVYSGRRGEAARTVLRTPAPAALAGISASGGLLAVTTVASSARAVTVVAVTGGEVAVLSGHRHRLWALGFAPAAGDVLLLVQERGERYVLATWEPGTGLRTHPWCGFDTEITARWYPDGRRVLIRHDRHGRSTVLVADLARRSLVPVPLPPGSVFDAAPRSCEDVHVLWTDTAHPPTLVSTAGTALPVPDTGPVEVPGQHSELWTSGPDGPVHTLISVPAGSTGRPAPLVFLVHGGPADHDRDAYDPVVHSLVATGFAVARVNYRGSTGYGTRWRSAFGAGVGLTQVADLVAVRADLVRRGLARPDAIGMWGTSWGGYLVLLALGTHPDLWQAGVAVKPVADCAAAYRAGTPALRAFDERLFGGTPDEVPERYADSSPARYAARVRAPLLVVAATRDVKCPPGQVRDYLAALAAHDVPHDVMWLESGHDGYVGHDHVAVLRRAVTHLARLGPESPRPGRGGDRGEAGTPAVPAHRGHERRSAHAEGHHRERPAHR